MDVQTDGRQPHVVAIVDKIKSEGIFDALRKDCLAEVDLKPAYHNLKQKVEHACANFLSRVAWSTKLNKNQLREQMRRNLEDSGVLQSGVKRIVHQVVSPKVDLEIKPKVAKVVCEHLGLDPDDIHTEDEEHEADGQQQYSQAEASIGLYPYNPLDAPSVHTSAPSTLPGFEGKQPVAKEDGAEVRFEEPEGKADDKSSDRQEDMDISDRSDSRSTSRASTKKSIDMDCTVTSDEDEAAVNGTDLSKGLAAYMATNSTNESRARNEDDMSISSGDTSSKHESTTPDIGDECKDSSVSSLAGKKKTIPEAAPVERREMRRNRTRNKKYMSDEFESIFTANKELLGDTYSQGYVEEEIITTDDLASQGLQSDTASSNKRSPRSDEPKTSSASKRKSPVGSSHYSYNLRGSARSRNCKEESAGETSAAPKTDGSKEPEVVSRSDSVGKVAARGGLRRSKSGNQSQESTVVTAATITPRRYTRSSAKQASLTPPPTRDEGGGNPSSGSTPTQDEPSHAQDPAIGTPFSLVLSDIGLKLKPSEVVSATNQVAEKSSALASCNWASASEQVDTYEPELHFDEMSRDMTEAAQTANGSRSATPTLDEPTSPDRGTESPTSPTTSSPSSNSLPQISASLVAIPLEGEGSHNQETSFCPPPNLADEAPPLPPGLPPLPSSPIDELQALPPPEPDCEAEEIPPEPCGAGDVWPPGPDDEGNVSPPGPDDEGNVSSPEPDGEEDEEIVFQVLSEVGGDDISTAEEPDAAPREEIASDSGGYAEEDNYEEMESALAVSDDDLEELERLAQRKLEILKAIDLPDSALERVAVEPSSEEEEGQISDSSEEERRRAKKKKSKKSKKKKSKKEKRKRADYDDMGSSSKKSKYY